MSYDPDSLDPYTVPGNCWCADARTVLQLRQMGHDARCTQARHAWAANMRRLSADAAERQRFERIGREVAALLDNEKGEHLGSPVL